MLGLCEKQNCRLRIMISISFLCYEFLKSDALPLPHGILGPAYMPVAADSFFSWSYPDGTYRLRLQSQNQWRTETWSPSGAVTREYFFKTPEGGRVKMSYNSGVELRTGVSHRQAGIDPLSANASSRLFLGEVGPTDHNDSQSFLESSLNQNDSGILDKTKTSIDHKFFSFNAPVNKKYMYNTHLGYRNQAVQFQPHYLSQSHHPAYMNPTDGPTFNILHNQPSEMLHYDNRILYGNFSYNQNYPIHPSKEQSSHTLHLPADVQSSALVPHAHNTLTRDNILNLAEQEMGKPYGALKQLAEDITSGLEFSEVDAIVIDVPYS